MLELCQMINSEGYAHDEEHPKLKVILFGELFNVRIVECMMFEECFWNSYFAFVKL